MWSMRAASGALDELAEVFGLVAVLPAPRPSAILRFARFRHLPYSSRKYLFMLDMLPFVVSFRPWPLDDSQNGMV